MSRQVPQQGQDMMQTASDPQAPCARTGRLAAMQIRDSWGLTGRVLREIFGLGKATVWHCRMSVSETDGWVRCEKGFSA